MLLAIDVGNTNTVIGVYDGNDLLFDWRISTVRESTADEFNVLANSLFLDKGLDRQKIEKIIISSVVPSSVPILNAFCERYLNLTPSWIDADSVKKLIVYSVISVVLNLFCQMNYPQLAFRILIALLIILAAMAILRQAYMPSKTMRFICCYPKTMP